MACAYILFSMWVVIFISSSFAMVFVYCAVPVGLGFGCGFWFFSARSLQVPWALA